MAPLTCGVMFCMVLVVPALCFAPSNYSCPTWLYCSNVSQGCECGISTHGVICNTQTMEVLITDNYCTTYSGCEGLFYGGDCPFSYKSNHSDGVFSRVPTDPDLLNSKMCGPYNRKGLLCGECIDGYGPGVYTLDRKCVDCSKFSTGSAIFLYLLLEFVPVLLFFLCVTVFRLDLTSGPMLGYIIFCQVISYGLNALSIKANYIIYSRLPGHIGSVFLSIIEFWNLNILKTVVPPFCISDKLTGLHVVFLNSVGATYPLIIAITSLILIDLHSRQCKAIVILFKPLSVVLKLTKSKAITSDAVIHTFASFLLLSSTKTVFVFATMLEFVPVISSVNGFVYRNVLYADASIEYCSHEHLLFLLLALVQCLLFVFLPSLLLFLYPTRLYRWISQRISARNHLAITTFVEALNHCFRDGLNDTTDYRALAGVVVISVPLTCLFGWLLDYTQCPTTITCFITLCLSLVTSHSRPFKSTIANMSASFYFTLNGAIALTYSYWSFNQENSSLELMFAFILPLSQTPVLGWALYNLVCYILKKFR